MENKVLVKSVQETAREVTQCLLQDFRQLEMRTVSYKHSSEYQSSLNQLQVW